MEARGIVGNFSMTSARDDDVDFTERQEARVPVQATARLSHPNLYSFEVRIRDVSPLGFMAECGEHVAIGSFVSLDVPGIGPVEAQVRWQLGGRMGGKFEDPVSLDCCEWTATKIDGELATA